MDTPKQILIDEITQLEKDMDILANCLRLKKQHLAEINCPFVVGDVLVNRNFDKAVLQAIEPYFNSDNYAIKISKINKNGKTSKVIQNAYLHELWVKL